MTATETINWLKTTGTPSDTLAACRDWVAAQPAEPTAEALYGHMVAGNVGTLGTHRKLGKRLWGDGFEPLTAPDPEPLAEQLATAIQTVARLEKENASLRDELRAMTDRCNWYKGRVEALPA